MTPEEPDDIEVIEDPNCPPGQIYLINWMIREPLPENWLDQWSFSREDCLWLKPDEEQEP